MSTPTVTELRAIHEGGREAAYARFVPKDELDGEGLKAIWEAGFAAAQVGANAPRPFGDEDAATLAETVNGIELMRERSPLKGWAVISDVNSERFYGFFTSFDLADAFIRNTKDEDDESVFGDDDPWMVPAVVIGSPQRCTGLYWADGTPTEGKRALMERLPICGSKMWPGDDGR